MTITNINEDNLINQLMLKNESALAYAIELYGGLVKAVIRKHLYGEVFGFYGDECIDDVFMAVWDNADCFDPAISSLKNWIAGIARYKSLYYVRQYMRIKKVSGIENAADVAAYEDKDLASILEQEISEEMEQLLKNLNEQDRRLFTEIYVHEKPVSEVSGATGMRAEVIYNRLSRGRKKLFNLLQSTNARRV